MKIDLLEDVRHLWINLLGEEETREVIIDREEDVRICDGSHVVKVMFTSNGKIATVLVDDIIVSRIQ